MVRKAALVVLMCMVVASLALAKEGSWTGWVTDTHCGVKGTNAGHKKCATDCVKGMGAKYALYDGASKKVFILSDQEKAETFAAQEVVVKGDLDEASNTIKVASIEAKK